MANSTKRGQAGQEWKAAKKAAHEAGERPPLNENLDGAAEVLVRWLDNERHVMVDFPYHIIWVMWNALTLMGYTAKESEPEESWRGTALEVLEYIIVDTEPAMDDVLLVAQMMFFAQSQNQQE